MRPINKPSRQQTLNTVDADILGQWWIGPRGYRIDPDGTFWVTDRQTAYTVSTDGQELSHSGETRTRVYGTGQTLIGVWRIEYIEGPDIDIEETHYRSDGTYAFQWTHNGALDIFGNGTFGDTGTAIQTT